MIKYLALLATNNDITIVLQKRVNGQCTLTQTGGWANILAINIVYLLIAQRGANST